MTQFHKRLRIGVALSVLALPAGLAGCAGDPNTKAAAVQAKNSNVPPFGPTRTIIAPNGSSYTCRIAGGAICAQP